ncbi:MAG TPA: hypothetical protein PLH38_02330 [Clostridia bacterium]|nr:hypothetical protein [Clostridia bacterium]
MQNVLGLSLECATACLENEGYVVEALEIAGRESFDDGECRVIRQREYEETAEQPKRVCIIYARFRTKVIE